jgi:hypothetical protein
MNFSFPRKKKKKKSGCASPVELIEDGGRAEEVWVGGGLEDALAGGGGREVSIGR